MLNSLRKGAAGWAAKILIGLLILAFASWGLAGIFDPSSNRVLATVGDEKISPQEFNRYMRQIQQRYRFPAEILNRQGENILGEMINERLVDVHAQDLQLGVPLDVVRREIFGNRSFLNISGEFSRPRFNETLRQLNYSENQYVENIRRGNLRGQILDALTSDISVPDQLAKAQHQFVNESRVIQYFFVNKKAIAKIEAPKDELLQEQYEKTKALYRAPEYRKVAYINLSADALKGSFKIPEKDIKDAYDSLKKKYTKAEQRTLKQISFPDLKKAEEAHKKLASGKKFEDVAKEYGQSKKDIELGQQTKSGIIDKAIAEAAFALKKGAFSKPVKGTLNTVIVMVTDIKAEIITPLEKVSKEIADKLALEKAGEKIAKLEKTIEDDTAEGTKLNDIAKKYSLTYSEVDLDSRGNGIDGKTVSAFPASAGLLKAVFASDVGEENNPVNVGKGAVWYDVLKITKSRTKSFDEVKKQITEKWIADEESKALDKKAGELVAELKKGAKVAAVAKSVSSKVINSKPVKRNAPTKELIAPVLKKAFDASLKDVQFTNAAKSDERIVFQVTEVTKAKALDEKAGKALKVQLSRNMASDIFSQYINGLRSEYNWNLNKKALQEALRNRQY